MERNITHPSHGGTDPFGCWKQPEPLIASVTVRGLGRVGTARPPRSGLQNRPRLCSSAIVQCASVGGSASRHRRAGEPSHRLDIVAARSFNQRLAAPRIAAFGRRCLACRPAGFEPFDAFNALAFRAAPHANTETGRLIKKVDVFWVVKVRFLFNG